MSKKSNIYLFNSLKSVEVKFNQDESLIISKLLDMNNRLSNDNEDSLKNLSRELLTIFDLAEQSMWSQVDRVCISLRDSFSNQISISSADQNAKVLDNVLISGYSCVVDENSSLMSLKDGEIRTYDDIDNIISAFNLSNRKVQRSIGLISQTKIKSGLTIPLVRKGKTIGFLFFNSTKINTFQNLTAQDFSILCLVKLIVQNIASNASIDLMDSKMLEALGNVQNKNQIQLKNLKQDLEMVAREYFNKDLVFSIDSKIALEFLLPNRKFINAVFVCLKNVGNINNIDKVNLTLIAEEGSELHSEISFNSSPVDFSLIGFKNVNSIIDFRMKAHGEKIKFTLKYEAITDNLLYSVV